MHVQIVRGDFQKLRVDDILLVLGAWPLNELSQCFKRVHDYLKGILLQVGLECTKQLDHCLHDVVVVSTVDLLPEIVLYLKIVSLAYELEVFQQIDEGLQLVLSVLVVLLGALRILLMDFLHI